MRLERQEILYDCDVYGCVGARAEDLAWVCGFSHVKPVQCVF